LYVDIYGRRILFDRIEICNNNIIIYLHLGEQGMLLNYEFFAQNKLFFVFAISIAILITALNIFNVLRVNGLQRKYKRFMKASEEVNIEQLLLKLTEKIELHDKILNSIESSVKKLEE